MTLFQKLQQALGESVDKCYHTKPFTNETERIEFLWEMNNECAVPVLEFGKNKNVEE